MFRTTIISSEIPQISELEAAADAAAWANARWYATEAAAGREPPCCLGCAGVCYLPDTPSSTDAVFHTGAELIARGHASCGEVAAYSLGVARAQRRAPVGRVRLSWQRPHVLHAVVQLEGGRILDPSSELDRCGG